MHQNYQKTASNIYSMCIGKTFRITSPQFIWAFTLNDRIKNFSFLGVASLFELLKNGWSFIREKTISSLLKRSMLDPFGDTLTTTTAAAALICQCLIVQKEINCFDAAIQKMNQFVSGITVFYGSRLRLWQLPRSRFTRCGPWINLHGYVLRVALNALYPFLALLTIAWLS